MARKVSTHRFDAEVQAALDRLSKTLGQPKNRLINEAVRLYVQQRSQKVERELESTLAALRTFRLRTDGTKKAISAFVKAEAELGRCRGDGRLPSRCSV